MCLTDLWRVLGVLHDLAPEPIHRLIPLALNRKLSIDVLRAEDRLQVEPLSLAHDPLVQHILSHQIITPSSVCATRPNFYVSLLNPGLGTYGVGLGLTLEGPGLDLENCIDKIIT